MNWRDWFSRLRASFVGYDEADAIVRDVARAEHISGMDRRSFLRTALVGLTAAVVVDVDKLLWTPGEKAVFLPETFFAPDCGFATIDWVTREALRIMRNQLRVAKSFSAPMPSRYANQHIYVEIPNLSREPIDLFRFSREVIEPAATALARETGTFKGFAALELPKYAEAATVAKADGLIVRGVQAFDSYRFSMRTRLDIAGVA